jgi:hypothetical protein
MRGTVQPWLNGDDGSLVQSEAVLLLVGVLHFGGLSEQECVEGLGILYYVS